MNKKVFGIIGVILVLLVGGVFVFKGNNSEAEEIQVEATKKIEHALGEVTIKGVPEKAVVLDYGALDALDALGIDIVGLPKDGALPEYLNKFSDDKYASVGSIKEPNLEAINELKPDVIFMAGRMEDYYDQLSEIAPTIYVDSDGANYIESFTKNMKIFGEIFDVEDKANKLIDNVNKEIDKVRNKIKTLDGKASLVMVNGRNISAFGAKSRFGLLFNELGFPEVDENLEESTHGQEVSFEYLVEANPQYLFVVDRNSIVGNNEVTVEEVIENELVKKTDAYKNGHIVYLNSVNWYTVSGGYTSTINMIDEVLNAIK